MNIVSFSPFGYEGNIVSVEVDLRRGIPAVDLVGLADNAVKEARERMRSAIINSGFDFPKERVLISLSPADLKKEGAGFDLAIALAVMINPINENLVDKTVLVVRTDTVHVNALNDAITTISKISSNLAGCILNDVHMNILPFSFTGDDESNRYGGYRYGKHSRYGHYGNYSAPKYDIEPIPETPEDTDNNAQETAAEYAVQ